MTEAGLLLAALGAAVVLLGLARVPGSYPKCSRCRAPLVAGFEAADETGHYCRACTRATGRRPWYWKPGVNP